MENIFILTIRADHDFGHVVHRSAWRDRDAAWDYVYAIAWPELKAAERPEYGNCFIPDVEEIAILG